MIIGNRMQLWAAKIALVGFSALFCCSVMPADAHTIITKTRTPTSLAIGGVVIYTITVDSSGQTAPGIGFSMVDTLPPGFSYRSTQAVNLFNGAAFAGTYPTPGSTTPTWGTFNNPNVAAPYSYFEIVFEADVVNPVCSNVAVNSAIATGGTQHGTIVPAIDVADVSLSGPSADLTVIKATSTPVVVNNGAGMTASYTITVTNSSGRCEAQSVKIKDVLPPGFTYASTGAITFTGAPASASRVSTVNPTDGSSTPTWGDFLLPGGTSVTIPFTVNIAAGTPNGGYDNVVIATTPTSGATVNNFGPGASVTLTRASLTKAFAPASIPINGTSTLTFTVTKPTGTAISGLSFTDTLPSGMTGSGAPASPQCGGTVTRVGGTITVTGANLAAAATSCTINVTITSATAGSYTNNSANISGLGGGLSAAGVNATLIVTGAVLTKNFAPAVIGVNRPSTLALTLTSAAGTPALTGLGFTDTLPAGVVVSGAVTTPQCGGTITGVGGTITVAGASLAAGSATCTINVTVTSATPGMYINNQGNVTGLSGAVTALTASAALTVQAVVLDKAFIPNTIVAGGTSVLRLTITNGSGTPAQAGVNITDTLPAGVTVSGAVTTPQCGGAITGAAGTITVTGATLALGTGACQINVTVTSAAAGVYTNTTGNITASVGGSAAGINTNGINAVLTVGGVALTKGFGNSTVDTGTAVVLTFTLTNSTGNPAQTGLAFTDTFATNLAIANNTTTNTCGGTLADLAGGAIGAGDTGVQLTGGTMAAGTASCTITVRVTSNTPGTYLNTSPSNITASPQIVHNINHSVVFNGVVLRVTKTTSTPIVVLPGLSNSTATYTVSVVNSGNATTAGVQITDTLPAPFTYASTSSVTLSGGATRPSTVNPAAGATVPLWDAFSIPANGRVTITFVITVPNAAVNATYHNSASVTTTGGAAITNFNGATSSADDVSVVHSVTLSGFVYRDANLNGIKESGEDWTTGSGVFVNLLQGGVTIQSVSVGAGAGGFTFTNVVTGSYTIIVTRGAIGGTPVAPSGWMFTFPNTGALPQGVGSSSVNNITLGLMNGARLSGTVFRDTGASGGTAHDVIQSGGETGISGVTLRLMDSTGTTTHATAVTGGDGTYSLVIPFALTTGTVLRVVEFNLAGYQSTGGQPGTTGGTYNRNDYVGFTLTVGTNYTAVNFGDVPPNIFANDNQRTILPGSTAFHPHTFTTGTAGTVSFSTTNVTTPVLTGWLQFIYHDLNCNGLLDGAEGSSLLTGSVPVVAGSTVCIIVKENAPPNAPFNAQDQITVTATFTYVPPLVVAPAPPSPLTAITTRTDITIIGNATNAGLALLKIVDKATALPGDNLVYVITYSNNSSGSLSNIVINDATPTFTTFVSTSCGTLGAGLTGCSVTTQPAVGAIGSIRWTLTGGLASVGTGTVTYTVQILP